MHKIVNREFFVRKRNLFKKHAKTFNDFCLWLQQHLLKDVSRINNSASIVKVFTLSLQFTEERLMSSNDNDYQFIIKFLNNSWKKKVSL